MLPILPAFNLSDLPTSTKRVKFVNPIVYALPALTPTTNRHSYPLQFIEFANGNNQFIALVDSGSQLNLINSNLLPHINHRAVPCTIPAIRGVGGTLTRITEWIELSI